MGLVHVYTGNGKGKTTASFGLAMRAVGCGMKVAIIQFLKGDEGYCEIPSAKKLGIVVEQYGRKCFVNPKNPAKEDIELARLGLERARNIIEKKEFDMLILDEINVAIDLNLITLEDVLYLLKNRGDLEIILTGRNAKKEIIEEADYVTEMKEIKHPFKKGISGRKGIEF
ncbi:MAG: cob(I)yrinic acid a,c-diamide adenosyltransferase [Thermoplasmata archaeon]